MSCHYIVTLPTTLLPLDIVYTGSVKKQTLQGSYMIVRMATGYQLLLEPSLLQIEEFEYHLESTQQYRLLVR